MNLKRLQLTQLEILKIIDAFCKKHDIRYSLYAGTLLGAVRHKGFIPWDDDLDICMSRKEYNRFLKAWEEDPQEGYLLQNKDNTPAFNPSFSKIRKDHTTFLQYEFERGSYHTGIFVDIFPIDRIPEGKLKEKQFLWDCMRYQLYTREFVPPEASAPVKAVSSFLLKIKSPEARKKAREQLLKKITRNNDNQELSTVAIETTRTMDRKLPKDLMDSFTELEFEGGKFLCIAKWHEYLEVKFGDYMQLPPEEEQVWRHHPIILDFEHNLDEL